MENEEVNVKMKIDGKEIKVQGPAKWLMEEDPDKLTITFMIGGNKLDKVELVFEPLNYIDEKTVNN